MKKTLIILVYFPFSVYASFPVSNSLTGNTDPSTDSWIPLIFAFWLLIIIIPIILIRHIIIKKNQAKNKPN
jgi:hypothetical protein